MRQAFSLAFQTTFAGDTLLVALPVSSPDPQSSHRLDQCMVSIAAPRSGLADGVDLFCLSSLVLRAAIRK